MKSQGYAIIGINSNQFIIMLQVIEQSFFVPDLIVKVEMIMHVNLGIVLFPQFKEIFRKILQPCLKFGEVL